MMEVLKKKNFPSKWIEWMKQIVEGGKCRHNHQWDPREFFQHPQGLMTHLIEGGLTHL